MIKETWRAYFIFFVFLAISLVIIGKLYYLQVNNGEYYEALAMGQQISFEEVMTERGDIFFSDGITTLAQTKKKIVVYIFPNKIAESDRATTTLILSNILGEDQEVLATQLQAEQAIKKEITEEQAEEIKRVEISGVYVDELLTRVYPQEETACHVVGFVNQAGEGQYGIEGYYNKALEGSAVFLERSTSPFGYLSSFFSSGSSQDGQRGVDIYLTLDSNIQYFAEKILKQAKEDWDIEAGQIIVSDPNTGKILALANYPYFIPNQFSEEKGMGVFLNSSIQKIFEPGSVFKPITMAAGLEENLITPETVYTDKGSVDVGGPLIYNFEKRVWGEQTMIDVLEESINTGVIFVEQKLGGKTFLKYLDRFGFFEETGISLQGEVFSTNKGLKNGYPRDFATASFGQGVEITSLQLVRAFGAIANGGKLMQPYIIEKVVEANGEQVITQPKQQAEAISEKTSAKLTAMLVSVVRNGSARRAQIPNYYIAAKTGTAQVALPSGGYSETETIQSFIGYFPALNPKALIFIRLDSPKDSRSAGTSVGPYFQQLAKHIIDLWQIPSSTE